MIAHILQQFLGWHIKDELYTLGDQFKVYIGALGKLLEYKTIFSI